MLGILQGLSDATAQENARKSRSHERRVLLSNAHLDRFVNQSRYNLDYAMRKADLESTLKSRQIDQAIGRQTLSQRAETHPLNMRILGLQTDQLKQSIQQSSELHPGRLKLQDANITGLEASTTATKQLTEQRGKTFDANEPYLKDMARLGRDQAQATLDLTRAQTKKALTPSGSSGSAPKPPYTYEQTKDMGKTDPFVGRFRQERRLWFDKHLPYDAPAGETSQKTLLSDHARTIGRQFRTEFPFNSMSIGDLRARASAYWQGMLEGEGAQEFLEQLQRGLPLEQRSGRIANAQQFFIDGVMNEIFNPSAARTVEQMPGVQDEIDPALIGQGEGWSGFMDWLTSPGGRGSNPDYTNRYGPTSETVSPNDTWMGPRQEGESWTDYFRRQRILAPEGFSERMGETKPDISPAETQPTILPADEQDQAIDMWLQNGEMDWDWFYSQPPMAQIRMVQQIPDHKQDEFIEAHDRAFGLSNSPR